MKFKLMVIDDRPERQHAYEKVLSDEYFDLIFVFTQCEYERLKVTPVDGYILDVFLDLGDWGGTDAAKLLKSDIQCAPRRAPVFLVSQLWGDTSKILDILKQAGESSASVVQYLSWGDFLSACKDEVGASERLKALQMKILSELTRWHGRSGFRPEPNDTIQILLLADMQFGDPDTDIKATFAENWIVKTLKSEARNAEGVGIPDLIVLAGDITYSGRPDQFALASDRLAQDLIAPLWGNNNIDRMRDRIIVVPGNHDVNLRFAAADKYYFSPSTKELKYPDRPILSDDNNLPYPTQKQFALEPFRQFAHNLTAQRELRESTSLSWVDRRFVHCGIRFFVLNSVAELDADTPDRASLKESETRGITRSLADDVPDTVFSIAVSHHALPPDGVINEKGVDNWMSVGKEFFSLHKIRMWLYGHYHSFGARSLNDSPFEVDPLWMVQIPTTRIAPSTRGFCVLELQRTDGKVTDAYVHPYVFENGRSERRPTRHVFG